MTALGTAFLAVTAFMHDVHRSSTPSTPSGEFRARVPWRSASSSIGRRSPSGPVLIGASLSITSYLVGASLGFTRGDAALRVRPFLGWCRSCLTWAAFTLLYYVVPNRAVKPRHALVGGLVAAFVFELMKRSFAFYVAQIPTYALVYGAFAVIPIFLLWIYFSWVVIVIGALITALAPDFAVLRDTAGHAASRISRRAGDPPGSGARAAGPGAARLEKRRAGGVASRWIRPSGSSNAWRRVAGSRARAASGTRWCATRSGFW